MRFDWHKLKNENAWLAVLFCGGLIWIFGSFFADLSFPDSGYNFLGESKKVKLDPGKPVTQVFGAGKNNLNQIKIIVGNTDLWPAEKIVFELADASCETTLASDTMTFLTPEPHIYSHFNFPVIPDSAGRAYCFRTTYFSRWDRGDERPYLGASEGKQFTGWSYTNEGNNRVYESRTLQMRPAYGTGSLSGDLQQLNNRLSQYKPMFLKGTLLAVIFGAFLLGTAALVLRIIWSKDED